METIRNTGLGNSLLLRRTDTPPAAAADVSSDIPTFETPAAPEPSPSLAPAAEPETTIPQPESRKATKQRLTLRDRCTLYLDRQVNDQLDIAARIEGRERSEIVSDLLSQHLPRYRVEREK